MRTSVGNAILTRPRAATKVMLGRRRSEDSTRHNSFL